MQLALHVSCGKPLFRRALNLLHLIPLCAALCILKQFASRACLVTFLNTSAIRPVIFAGDPASHRSMVATRTKQSPKPFTFEETNIGESHRQQAPSLPPPPLPTAASPPPRPPASRTPRVGRPRDGPDWRESWQPTAQKTPSGPAH
jgi:hypothetical protein